MSRGPDIYRNLSFQAYGTSLAPPPNKLTRWTSEKWSSSIWPGRELYEGSDPLLAALYLFDFLHLTYRMGVRAAYKLSDSLTVNYWLDNGTQQS